MRPSAPPPGTRPLLRDRRFLPLFLCQALAALGDNLLRNALGVLAVWSSASGAAWMVPAAAAVFVLPAAVLSGVGGSLADRGDKARLLRLLRLVELPVACLAAWGLLSHRPAVVLAALAASGVTAALFGPAKYGILPDALPSARLPAANALVEGATFAAILLGTLGAGALASPALAPAVALAVPALSLLSLLAALLIPAAPPAAALPPPRGGVPLLSSTLALLRDLRADRRSWRAALANALFWALGVAALSLLPALVRDRLHGGAALGTLMLALFALGVGAGSALASFLCGGRVLLLPAGLGCLLAGAGLLAAALLSPPAGALHPPVWPTALALLLAAAGGGLLAVPSQAAVQDRAAPAHRARAVAASNVLAALAVAGTAALLAAAQALGAPEPPLLACAGLLALLLSPLLLLRLPAHPLPELAWLLGRVLFRLRLEGADHLPPPGRGCVLVPNHVSWLDGALLLAAIGPEPPLFAIDDAVANLWWVRPLLRAVPCLRVSASNPHALRAMVAAVGAGSRLVLFPEGRITVTGSLMQVQDGAATVADRAGAPVVPLRIRGAERTPFGRLSPALTRRALFPRVELAVLPPRRLPASGTGRRRRESLTAALRDLMEEAAAATALPPGLTLPEAAARALRARGLGRLAVQDPVSGALSGRRLLAGADVLGGIIAAAVPTPESKSLLFLKKKKQKDFRPDGTERASDSGPNSQKFFGSFFQKRTASLLSPSCVALLLPTSNAAALCVLGLSSRGLVPAMLNGTAGPAALCAALRCSGARLVVTSRAFVERAALAPALAAMEGQGARVLFLEDARAGVRPARRLRALARTVLRPGAVHVRRAPEDPAAVLFTSGSTGTPRGVVLTHANLLANVSQLAGRIGLDADHRLLNALPVFHAFGLTAGLVLPLVSGLPVFLYPSPLHYAAIPQVAYGWNATVMFGTSTFLRGYARRARALDFRSLRLVVAGAEPLAPAVRELWAERFGLRVLEGYGVTECAPVLAVNTPASHRPGTVGRLLPGIEHRLLPVEGVEGAGRLLVRGPNVMAGYLAQDGTLLPPPDGWHDTGDVVAVEGDGHLRVVGRLSRFAKAGGEMIALAAVEALALALWPDDPAVAVALPDPRRGERVVLLTTRADAGRAALLAQARRSGAPDLLVPAGVHVVERLPLLGSGKPDVLAATALARTLESPRDDEEEDEAAD